MTERQTPNGDDNSVPRNEGEELLTQAETRVHLQAVCRVKGNPDETPTARVPVSSPEVTREWRTRERSPGLGAGPGVIARA